MTNVTMTDWPASVQYSFSFFFSILLCPSSLFLLIFFLSTDLKNFVFPRVQMIPVVASNRYGTEILLHDDDDDSTDDAIGVGGQPRKKKREQQRITFYGKTFITDNTGKKVAEVSSDDMDINNNNDGFAIITSTIDPEKNRKERLAWGLFRDRRPELYGALLTKDGTTTSSSS